jgi:hypothetical protein
MVSPAFGMRVSIAGYKTFKNSTKSVLTTKANGSWQITRNVIKAVLKGSETTRWVRLVNFSTVRSVDSVEGVVLLAAACFFV